jgi:hypothetical protein
MIIAVLLDDNVVCATKYNRYKTSKDHMWQLSQRRKNLQEKNHNVI